MRNQQKCARIVKNKHNFRHKTEIDSDNYMILYHNMVEAAGVEPRTGFSLAIKEYQRSAGRNLYRGLKAFPTKIWILVMMELLQCSCKTGESVFA